METRLQKLQDLLYIHLLSFSPIERFEIFHKFKGRTWVNMEPLGSIEWDSLGYISDLIDNLFIDEIEVLLAWTWKLYNNKKK
ncbi:hypothetical protein [Metamycoplasma hyosynoviae]|uniref:hypothetical protein n=1 Tax=Metamycoplasma hyosynoviae TaxID=29559 RepID=UPI002362EB65|nr:hypothetical protein [Metamycoplasma hyosynoviae]MDD1373084.1 hypothetical protein [Metamycoplasma hyosynoviae]MDD7896116.1 hypothetical protein [Metamycoplasma hyosynoviae]